MSNYFTTKSWIFENVHRLSNRRPLIPELPAELSNSIVKSIFSKDRMFNSQRVPDLIKGELRGYQKFIVLIHSSSFEEVANLVARLDEIFVTVLKIKKENFPVTGHRIFIISTPT